MSGLTLTQRLLVELRERKAQIESEAFSAPPKDWAEYQHRFGQHEENARMLARVVTLAKGQEEDTDRG